MNQIQKCQCEQTSLLVEINSESFSLHEIKDRNLKKAETYYRKDLFLLITQ